MSYHIHFCDQHSSIALALNSVGIPHIFQALKIDNFQFLHTLPQNRDCGLGPPHSFCHNYRQRGDIGETILIDTHNV